MTITPDNLYALLPAILRVRDAENGGALQALVAILAEQGSVLERDIAQLYENLFIETCEEWVVPYIGDLIGMRGLPALGGASTYSGRAAVADALFNRSRKGTVSVLETVARDASGWPAHAVEYFSRLGWTQNPNHVRLDNPRTYALRDANGLELVGGPFDPTARTADIRSIPLTRGRYDIANIGIFLWRLQSYWLDHATAHPAPGPADGRYFFLPQAINVPLFNPVIAGSQSTLDDVGRLTTELDVPGRLRRRPLYDELEARRQATIDGTVAQPLWFDKDRDTSVLRVYTQAAAGAAFVEIAPDAIEIADLSDRAPNVWRRPSQIAYTPSAGGIAINVPISVAVDPVLGRVSFPTGVVPHAVRLGFAYGFSADMGSGPYDRQAWAKARIPAKVDWQIAVIKRPVTGDPLPPNTATLADALNQWLALPPGQVGVIVIADSEIYNENLSIVLKDKSELHIVAASWPATGGSYVPGVFEPTGLRPYVSGAITVSGVNSTGTLWLDGLWIAGAITVPGGPNDALGKLGLSHVTLMPGAGGLTVAGGHDELSIEIVRSLIGKIAITGLTPSLSVSESIIEATGGAAIAAPDVWASLQRCTIFGTVAVQRLEAGNTIFADLVTTARRQSGCVRYSYVPLGSATPRRFRCQPELAMSLVDKTERAAVAARIGPAFTSRVFASAAYAQLAATTSPEIATGAEDESEMGAFGFLMQPQRAAAARAALDEYMRAGLEAGIFFVT